MNNLTTKKKKRNIKKIDKKSLNFGHATIDSSRNKRRKKIKKKKGDKLPIKRNTTKLKVNGEIMKKLSKSKSTSQMRSKSPLKRKKKTGKKVKKIYWILIESLLVVQNHQIGKVFNFFNKKFISKYFN